MIMLLFPMYCIYIHNNTKLYKQKYCSINKTENLCKFQLYHDFTKYAWKKYSSYSKNGKNSYNIKFKIHTYIIHNWEIPFFDKFIFRKQLQKMIQIFFNDITIIIFIELYSEKLLL